MPWILSNTKCPWLVTCLRGIQEHLCLRKRLQLKVLVDILLIQLLCFSITRFQAPTVPSIGPWRLFIQDAIQIAVMSYVLDLSLGRLIASRNGYNIDANQVCERFLSINYLKLTVPTSAFNLLVEFKGQLIN